MSVCNSVKCGHILYEFASSEIRKYVIYWEIMRLRVSPDGRWTPGLLLIREPFIESLRAFGLQVEPRPLYQLLTFLMIKSILQVFLLVSDVL